jgi:SAM-dependent methyltransferase
MTWEEAVTKLQETNPNLAKDAYLGADIKENVEKFIGSEEWKETLSILKTYQPIKNNIVKVLDIGAGNGISTIALALAGYDVTSLEPDKSNIVGTGAIRKMADTFKVSGKVAIVEAFGEKLPFEDKTFEIVYGRQVMHHAYDLPQFVIEASRVLKANGVFLTLRDHVIKDETDKKSFLERHPLHKLYGGENAFTLKEYTTAIENSGLEIKTILKPAESPINYEPWSKQRLTSLLQSKIGFFSKLPFINTVSWYLLRQRLEYIPGRIYTIISIKN